MDNLKVKDFVLEKFFAAPGKWITIKGEKKLIPATDSNWEFFDWFHTEALTEKQAVLYISQSIAIKKGWDYACIMM